MNLTHLEGMRLTQALAHELAAHDFSRVEVVLCPPFTALRTMQTLIDSDRYEVVSAPRTSTPGPTAPSRARSRR